jgi:hypothetical protein
MAAADHPPKESDPRVLKMQELYKAMRSGSEKDPEKQKAFLERARKYAEESRHPPKAP